MTFANVIFIVFLLVSLLVFAVLFLLIRQIKKDGRLPAEKMPTLVMVLFLPAIVIYALVFKGIVDWKSEIEFEKNHVEVENFVIGAYQPLADSQRELLITLKEMQNLLIEIEELEIAFPSHANLVQQVKEEWYASRSGLYQVYQDTDREVRHAWIAHKTMDSSDVLAKFSKQAVQLNDAIKNAKKDYQAQLHGVQATLVRNVDAARQLLEANRKPPKSKKQKNKNATTLKQIKHFSDRTKVQLIDFLARIDGRLAEEFETLREIIRLSGQQAAKVRSYLLNNQDLEIPLSKVIADWNDLEKNSTARMNQVLYAAEAEYVALKLGLSQNNPAVKAMHKSLLVNLPAIVGQAFKERKSIDQSYNFKSIK